MEGRHFPPILLHYDVVLFFFLFFFLQFSVRMAAKQSPKDFGGLREKTARIKIKVISEDNLLPFHVIPGRILVLLYGA